MVTLKPRPVLNSAIAPGEQFGRRGVLASIACSGELTRGLQWSVSLRAQTCMAPVQNSEPRRSQRMAGTTNHDASRNAAQEQGLVLIYYAHCGISNQSSPEKSTARTRQGTTVNLTYLTANPPLGMLWLVGVFNASV